MKSFAILAALAGVAHADDAKPEDPAEQGAKEANLESNASRQGVTFSASFGPGLIIGSGVSDRVPAASLRLGHVATPHTVVTFELLGGTFVHSQGNMTLFDSNGALLIGGLYYVNPSVWIRGAGGLDVHTIDKDGTALGRRTLPGPGGAVGVGVDLLRRHFFVLGLEAFVAGGINRDGIATIGAFCLGLSYY